MVLLVSRLNKVAGPFLLRHGLSLRHRLAPGGVIRDNPTMDGILLLPLSQKLISLEVEQEMSARMGRLGAMKGPGVMINEWTDKTFDSIFGKGKEEETEKSDKNEVSILDKYLRPVLVPNERWSDVNRWRFHSRFIKWARAEYLKEAHGPALREAFRANPKLRQGPQISTAGGATSAIRKMLGATNEEKGDVLSATLPTTDSLLKAFSMAKWNRKEKDADAIWDRMTELATNTVGGQVIEIPGTSLRFADVPGDMDTSSLSVEDILELAGGHVASCGPLNLLCEECDVYQLWSKEYIAGLADYLLSRQPSSGSNSKTLVLDVGAGDGLLSRLLKEHFEAKQNAPHVVAVDDGSWGISPKTKEVERMKFADAIKKYSADYEHIIVLCSWMPMGQDWTASFRKEGVKEYILIGESDDGNCGCNWETWGNPVFREDDDDRTSPAYKMDRYKRRSLSSLAPYQFSRFDSADSINSTTISFRKH